VAIDLALVHRLLASQHPDLADRPLETVAEGFDNVTVRCGPDLAVRLPRRRLGAWTLESELTWLPMIADRVPVQTPAAVRVGEPTEDYPWRWAVVPWISGLEAAVEPPAPEEATHLGRILTALHAVAVAPDPPRNPYRGGPLVARAEATAARLDRLAGAGSADGFDVEQLRDLYAAGVEAEVDVPPRWLHGDIHPRNVIVDRGRIAGLIDWGDMCVGDPCFDLASAWLLFDPAHHDDVWDVYRPTEPTLTRARAWVVAYALMLHEAGRSGDPLLERSGREALLRVAAI
jgi:aminoglycoside phosphotransferase (APT) family kinase protein